MSSRNGQSASDGARRFSNGEWEALLERDRSPRFVLVDKDGRPVTETGLRVLAPDPVEAAPVTLPVTSTGDMLAIRSDGAATAAAIQLSFQKRRTLVEEQLAHEQAALASCRSLEISERERLAELLAAREELIAGLPRRLRRRAGRRQSRLARVTPWAMFVADAMFLSRAYGLLGPLPLPFHASVGVTNLTQIARALAVSFGMAFGLKLAGARIRDAVEEARERRSWLGLASDLVVAGLVVAAAVRLMGATAALQKALVAIVSGGSTISVPGSVFFSIVAFLGTISFAVGYYLAEPKLETILELHTQIETQRSRLIEATKAALAQLGVVRALRACLRGLRGEEAFELAEQAAHTERRVCEHIAGNPHLYGLQIDPAANGAV